MRRADFVIGTLYDQSIAACGWPRVRHARHQSGRTIAFLEIYPLLLLGSPLLWLLHRWLAGPALDEPVNVPIRGLKAAKRPRVARRCLRRRLLLVPSFMLRSCTAIRQDMQPSRWIFAARWRRQPIF